MFGTDLIIISMTLPSIQTKSSVDTVSLEQINEGDAEDFDDEFDDLLNSEVVTDHPSNNQSIESEDSLDPNLQILGDDLLGTI